MHPLPLPLPPNPLVYSGGGRAGNGWIIVALFRSAAAGGEGVRGEAKGGSLSKIDFYARGGVFE